MVPSEQNLLIPDAGLKSVIPVVAAMFIAAAVVSACSPETKRYVPNVGQGYATPTMSTADVATLISDSGYTRYKLDTPLWQIFDDAEEPFWRFPDGLAVEQYDLNMNPVSNVVCDSAIYFSRKKLWRLDGNVVMVNTDADSFLTQQLFWDQARRVIHSDSFIHIVRTDRVIEGYGFESDQSMKYYTVRRPTAILPVDSDKGKRKADADSSATDSAKARKRSATARTAPAAAKPKPAQTADNINPDDKVPDGAVRSRRVIEPVKRK